MVNTDKLANIMCNAQHYISIEHNSTHVLRIIITAYNLISVDIPPNLPNSSAAIGGEGEQNKH